MLKLFKRKKVYFLNQDLSEIYPSSIVKKHSLALCFFLTNSFATLFKKYGNTLVDCRNHNSNTAFKSTFKSGKICTVTSASPG